MAEHACDWDTDSFTAYAVYTGENRLIEVQGSGTCPRSGYRIQLAVDNPGIVPEPGVLHLRLVETPPDVVGGDVLTPHQIDEYFEISQDVNTVVVRQLQLRLQVNEPA